jgi:hypothetical protein
MENGFVIQRHHGRGSRVGVRVALSNAVETGFRHVGQFLCAIRGHELFMHFEPRRLSLRCESCGYESPGWEIGRKPSDAPRALCAIDRFTRPPSRTIRRAAWHHRLTTAESRGNRYGSSGHHLRPHLGFLGHHH